MIMSKQFDLLNKYNEGKANNAEKRQLFRLLNYGELWTEEFDIVWDHSFGVMRKSTDRRILKSIKKATKPKQTFFQKQYMQIATCVAIVISFIVSLHFWHENLMLTTYADMKIEVGKGQKLDVTLPDSTKVSINSDSQLCYGKDFNGRIRKVRLSGEAYFQVIKDPHSPFIVEAGGLVIQALGTSFNVTAYPSENVISTYLEMGIIEVKSARENLRLVSGESIIFMVSNGEMRKKEMENNHSYLAWLANEMFFENEPFTEIIKRLERQYNVQFSIKSEKLKTITFSGTLKNSNLQSALDALVITSPVRYQNTPDGIELYSE
jgi:ferric-dicitrate binding protein FerR (iron transport regulator)